LALTTFTLAPGGWWRFCLFLVGFFALGSAVVLESRKNERLSEMQGTIDEQANDLAKRTVCAERGLESARRTAHELLVSVATLCPGDQNNTRVTVYERVDEQWVRVGRYSASTVHRESGRKAIPLESGLLHRAMERSKGYAKDLPDPHHAPGQYEKEQRDLGLPEGLSRHLGMASRSYALFRFEGHPSAQENATFVICIESTEPQGADVSELERLLKPWLVTLHGAFSRLRDSE
jgi:hypothetical protein